MSFILWKHFLEDDVDGFRQFLARATYVHGSSKAATASAAIPPFKIGSPGNLPTSPRTPTKPRKITGTTPQSGTGRSAGHVLTRADINARDNIGRTILHLAASSHNHNATEFVRALLEVPIIDLYIQDSENGWTALHRALYAGNIDIAHAILMRDALNATDFASQSRTQVGGLVRIKDHEGNSPFEVFGLTIAPRTLQNNSGGNILDLTDDDDTNSVDVREDVPDNVRSIRQVRPHTDLKGDEAFAFGSNKNLSLGLGDEDDRQFPEQIQLKRPEHLLWRLYEDHKAQRSQSSGSEDTNNAVTNLHQSDALPAIIRNKPIRIQNVVMAKLHTAVLTDDPISNLHVCGFGPGGRLGAGDEITRFDYICIQGGGLASRRVASVALGQDHCVAICSSGEVFTWGSNKYGQLGYTLPEVSPGETPIQLTPRQLYGLVKKESIIGAAASSIHSVIYTATSLYTFGKNEGQLGLMDADARSLQIQDIPRRVGVSLLQSQIMAISAIERATVVLLENRDVIVFTHYGFTKVLFPLEESNIFLSQGLPTRYSKEANTICKITSGGNTIGALSTFGQVFTVDVPKPSESVPSNVSTTNPTKARNALPLPSKVWTIKKSHMSAVDVAIGQGGSIILCTEAGSVWRKEKRANIKTVHTKSSDGSRQKDYKFVRVPHLTRVVAVRSNAFGAFTAVRKDCDVTKEQISVGASTLVGDLFPLLSFFDYGQPLSTQEDEAAAQPSLRFWVPSRKEPSPFLIKTAILRNEAAEDDFVHLGKRFEPLSGTQYDVWITSNITEVRIPAHSIMLKSRSRVLRSCLAEFHQTYYFSIPDVLSIEYGQSGDVELSFQGADFLTLVNFVLYLYTETLVDVWHYTSKALHLATRYRQVRIELMKIASHLELRRLERAVRVMVDPLACITEDFELAYMDLDFYSNADVLVSLADGAERPAHSIILSSRCPFFEGLFHGRAAGLWLSSRKATAEGALEPTRIDLKHINADIFDLVLRHVYADTGDELFDHIVSKDLDTFIDVVIEVMSAANELMLDRLVQICQNVIGKFVTPRNVCGLLNTIAESSMDEFQKTALEYICLNMEGMLEQRLLADLDQYLFEELDSVVQDNQLAFMPIVRSERAQDELFERYTDLAEQVERSRQRRIDSMRLQNRHVEEDIRPTPKIRMGSYDKLSSSPLASRRMDLRMPEDMSPRPSPALTPNDTSEDMPFKMDEDGANLARSASKSSSPSLQPTGVQNLSTSARSTEGTLVGDMRSPDSQNPRVGVCSPVTESEIGGFELPKAAWKQSLPAEGKTDLKSIMEQASISRVSHLTQAMKAAGPPRASTQKLSQKERKRQQQQSQMKPELIEEPVMNIAMRSTPWTRVLPTGNPTSSPTLSQSHITSKATSSTQRPSMPPRQTVSNLTARQKEDQPQQKRSASSTATMQVASKAPSQIQSIQHAPSPIRSMSFVDAHTSMAEILAQQQGEKTAIREAAAKRSLQDIQQEQEFQEWWDQESKKVQEEEARANAASSSRSEKANRGKGHRRRGLGRGAASSNPKDRDLKVHDTQDQATSNKDGRTGRGGGEGRGRGSSTSRGGRGRPRQEHGANTSK